MDKIDGGTIRDGIQKKLAKQILELGNNYNITYLLEAMQIVKDVTGEGGVICNTEESKQSVDNNKTYYCDNITNYQVVTEEEYYKNLK